MQTNKRGRPKLGASDKREEPLLVRLNDAEKETFLAAANLAGTNLSVWARERLRRAAIAELQSARQPVAILEPWGSK